MHFVTKYTDPFMALSTTL